MGLKPLNGHALVPVPAIAQKRQVRAAMNKTEARYAAHLDLLLTTGKIRGWGFQRITLRLGDDCRYTPDFDVQVEDGTLEYHEVKGFWRDDAKVKIRVAADRYPWFSFRAIQWDQKDRRWVAEYFEPKRGAGDSSLPPQLFPVSD